MKSFIIAFACIALAAADVSHLNLNRQYLPPDNHHHSVGAASSVSATASHLHGQGSIEGRFGTNTQQQQSQDIPDNYGPLSNDISVDVPVVHQSTQLRFGGEVGQSASVDVQRFPGDSESSYTPAHLREEQQHIPGDNAASYTPAHLREEQQHIPGDNAASYTPAHLQVQEQHIPGDNAASYTPAHLREEQQHIPGDNAASYTPAHLQVQEQASEPEPAVHEQQQYAPAPAQQHYAPAQEQLQEAPSYQNTQLRFGGEEQQHSASVAQSSAGIDTQYGTNGGYVY